MAKIYHNPRCGKSRQTLKLLEEKNIPVEVILYLKDIPDEKELTSVLKKLKMKPKDLIRKGEKIFQEKYANMELSDNDWIQAMAEHPILIERPIVIEGQKAKIGRPPEQVLELFS
jgi:arsenate reductase